MLLRKTRKRVTSSALLILINMFVKPLIGLAIKVIINQATIVMNKVILIFRFLYWGLEAAYQELLMGKSDLFKGAEAQYKAA